MRSYILHTLLVVVAILLVVNNSQGQESPVDTSTIRTLRIDPTTASGGNMSQVFDEINFIPLETTKESVFGDIGQLEVTESLFIVFDHDTKCILLFDRKGKYKTKIDVGKVIGGRLSPEDIDVYGFELYKKSSDYMIEIRTASNVYVFDTNAKQIDHYNRNSNAHISTQEYIFKDSVKLVSYYQNKKSEDKALYGYALLKNTQVLGKYFEIDTGKYSKTGDFAVGGPSFIETDNPEVLHAVRYYDYNIYQITSKGISIAYTLVFPSTNTIPYDFNRNKKYLGKKLDYFFKNPENIFGIGYTYQIGKYLYVKCGSLSANIRRNGSFVYDLENDYLISLNRLDPDSLSHHLPVIGRWDNDFKKYDGQYLYASLSSLELFSYHEQVRMKGYNYPAAMQNYFKNGDKKDNPVIIQLKPKK
ncbi:6-bladed beta-propeller [Parapedobacter sp. 10938]|uniref:6-bladed beta-propeller n=1 Tax=Parapedobacter flavus TaxID=3110225 RepID=UPI002DBCD879|nr:6-bladed beta-propeller [Parapedobacter sp. 10938]MEC3878157.1 6-bladed beta-propeller [Parapedobacter sp. 10938]